VIWGTDALGSFLPGAPRDLTRAGRGDIAPVEGKGWYVGAGPFILG
jgi:hypothetical protein